MRTLYVDAHGVQSPAGWCCWVAVTDQAGNCLKQIYMGRCGGNTEAERRAIWAGVELLDGPGVILSDCQGSVKGLKARMPDGVELRWVPSKQNRADVYARSAPGDIPNAVPEVPLGVPTPSPEDLAAWIDRLAQMW